MKQGNAPIILIVVIILVSAIAAVAYFSRNTSDTVVTSLPTSVYESSSTETVDDEMMNDEMDKEMSESKSQTNKYLAYSPEALVEGVGKTRVLFFYANWCPTCIPVDKELQANFSTIPDGTLVYRVNYNDSETDASEKELALKYGVTYQHTFVIIDDEGNEVTKWNGGGLEKLLTNLQ